MNRLTANNNDSIREPVIASSTLTDILDGGTDHHTAPKPARSWSMSKLLQHAFTGIEPIAFVCGVAFSISLSSYNEQVRVRVCHYNLNLNETECTAITTTSTNGTSVAVGLQHYFLRWTMCQAVLTTLPAVVIAWFVGAWSDTFGRKPPLILTIFGLAIHRLIQLWFLLDFAWPPYFSLISAAFAGVFGNPLVLVAIMFAYAADKTSTVDSERYRALRIGVIVGLVGIGLLIGGVIGHTTRSNMKLSSNAALITTAVSFTMYSVCLSFVVLTLRETRHTRLRQQIEALYPRIQHTALGKFGIALLHMIALKNLYDTWRVLFRSRPHNIRIYFWILVIATTCYTMQLSGETLLLRQYCTSPPFAWSPSTWKIFKSVSIVVGLFAPLIVVLPLVGVVRARLDTVALVVGMFSCATGSLPLMFVKRYQQVVAATCFSGVLKYAGILTLPICLSRLISNRGEQGRAFALLATIESLALFLGMLSYYELYDRYHLRNIALPLILFGLSTGLASTALVATVIVCAGTWTFYSRRHENAASVAAHFAWQQRDSIASGALGAYVSGRQSRSISFANSSILADAFYDDGLDDDEENETEDAVQAESQRHARGMEESTPNSDEERRDSGGSIISSTMAFFVGLTSLMHIPNPSRNPPIQPLESVSAMLDVAPSSVSTQIVDFTGRRPVDQRRISFVREESLGNLNDSSVLYGSTNNSDSGFWGVENRVNGGSRDWI